MNRSWARSEPGNTVVMRPPSRGAAAVVKTCACGRRYTWDQWQLLPDRSIGTLPWGEVDEYRRCHCGSHIVVVLKEGDPAA